VGNHPVNGAGAMVRLLGVNRSGTEYQCVHGNGIFDGPSDAASLGAIAAWRANAVRVPLNEDCWLAINGVNPAYAGAGRPRPGVLGVGGGELPLRPGRGLRPLQRTLPRQRQRPDLRPVGVLEGRLHGEPGQRRRRRLALGGDAAAPRRGATARRRASAPG